MASTNPVAEAPNIWAVAQSQFDHAADKLDLDDGMRRVLRVPLGGLRIGDPATNGTNRAPQRRHSIGRGRVPALRPRSGGVSVQNGQQA